MPACRDKEAVLLWGNLGLRKSMEMLREKADTATTSR